MEFGLLHVLQHHPLAAFFLDYALIVGQVISGRADAVRAIASRHDLVHHRDRRQRSQFRIAVPRLDRQVILDLLQMARERFQAVRFAVVAQVHVGFVRSLVAEEFVVVSFIRADRDIERRIQIHPGHVAGVVIVG